MTDQDIIRAVAELDGQLVPHTPTEAERNSGSYYQWEPNYLTSRDAIIGVIKKKVNKITCHSFFDTLGIVVAQDTADCDGVYEYQGDGSYYEMWLLFMATPRRLCEALLRTTGKWKD